jgi:hypothetical protein
MRVPLSAKTMVVFTYRPRAIILNERGSQAWSLKPANARRCTYMVCTRNRYFADAEPEAQAAAPEEHGAAFLVGKITSVEPAPDDPERYIVRFGEFADLDPQPVVWPGHRNPVWYVDEIGTLGIDPDKLTWQSIPIEPRAAPEITEVMPGAPAGLTFDQARAGLAIMYRVPPANVEIVIRG